MKPYPTKSRARRWTNALAALALIAGGVRAAAAGQLYDIKADPGEQTNLWTTNKDIVAQLTTLLERYRKEGRSVPARK